VLLRVYPASDASRRSLTLLRFLIIGPPLARSECTVAPMEPILKNAKEKYATGQDLGASISAGENDWGRSLGCAQAKQMSVGSEWVKGKS